VGAIEVVSFDEPITNRDLEALEAAAEYAGPALAAAAQYEQERNHSLHSITRLSELYDLEKVFNATIEMDSLLAIIGMKVTHLLNAGAVHIWLVGGGEELVLMQTTGDDPTVPAGSIQNPGEGIAAEVSESGTPLLVAGDDERLPKRNADVAENPVTEVLQTLVHVSKEITSTLNMDRVLHAIVNGPNSVIPYERAAIALEQHGRAQIKAISGEAQLNPSNVDVKRLDDLLQSFVKIQGEISVRMSEELGDAPEGLAARFREYFEQSGMRAFHAIPLADDEGRIGVLTLESADANFLNFTHMEMVQVLASQATVALRNAQLYRDVPFISVLEPLVQSKKSFMAMNRKRRLALAAAAAAVVVLLTIFPFPMRLEGDAAVGPVRRALVQAEEAGAVHAVYVKEGSYVHRGDVLADMEDWEQRSSLAVANAKYQELTAEMNRALAVGDAGQAGIQRIQTTYWAAEIERRTKRLQNTHLHAPIDGFVVTPHVETMAGRHLNPGDLFAKIEDNTHATVDVALGEGDIVLAGAAQPASVKLDAYPIRTFRGSVATVSPKGDVRNDEPVFFARVDVPNPEHLLKPGMKGHSKISVGCHPLGYVLFRKPASWLYSRGWSWFGW
jgi:GAF domain-containing protein